MNEDLKYIFNNVNEWLKFAETKHAGLIVLNSGLAFGVLTIYSTFANYGPLILIGLLSLALAIFFSLLSLYPMIIKNHTAKPIKDPNLFFNADIAHLSMDTFKIEFLKSYSSHQFTAIENDLIKQTIFNAKVASRKYALFKYALICTTVGLGMPLLSVTLKTILG